jgi:membrane-associated protease RseP (regulator of RpoE activity)
LAILEKIVWVITLTIIPLVVILAKIGPIKSEISKDAVDADVAELNAGNAFLRQAQSRHGGVQFTPSHSSFAEPRRAAPVPRAPGAPPRRDVPEDPLSPYAPPVQPNPASVVQAGVQPTVYVPASAREKYQHFEDLVDLGNTAAGGDVDYYGQTAFQIREIAEGSPLATQLGFQAGDIIISVNGQPANTGNARQLYDALKNETQFQVEIDRGGQRLTIPYHLR